MTQYPYTYAVCVEWAKARGQAVPRCDSPIVQGWMDRVQLAASFPEREDYEGEPVRYLGRVL